MSRRSHRQQREQSQVHAAHLVPITELPHLSGPAIRRGETDRKVLVDLPDPQKVRTRGRRPGQWLGSGEPVRVVRPQYVTAAEIEQAEQQQSPQAQRAPIRGHAFEGLTGSDRDREGWER